MQSTSKAQGTSQSEFRAVDSHVPPEHGILFWNRESTWFLINRRSRAVMIGATSDESRTVHEARFSIEEILEGREKRTIATDPEEFCGCENSIS